MASKPVIMVLHGAWHPPACYAALSSQLEGEGYTVVMPTLPTLGSSRKTWKDDVEAIHQMALPLFEKGLEVVVVAHSYGGIPGTQAVAGQQVGDRASQGKKGGFKSFLYMCAFCLPKGLDMYKACGSQYLPFVRCTTPYSGNFAMSVDEGAMEAFYNESSSEDAKKYYSMLQTQSQASFETPVTVDASDLTIPCTFLITEKDQAIPAQIQEMMASNYANMRVERIDAGHSPWLSKPEELAAVIGKVAIGP